VVSCGEFRYQGRSLTGMKHREPIAAVHGDVDLMRGGAHRDPDELLDLDLVLAEHQPTHVDPPIAGRRTDRRVIVADRPRWRMTILSGNRAVYRVSSA